MVHVGNGVTTHLFATRRSPLKFQLERALLEIIPAASYSPTPLPVRVPSAPRGLTSVFGMGTGVTHCGILALAAYNAGEGTVDSFLTGRPLRLTSGKVINPRALVTGGLPRYRETLAYVKSAIALFSVRSAQTLKPTPLSVLTNTKTHGSKTRDFSLDVYTGHGAQLLRRNSNSNAFFIEVP